jgi:hypothetical protein
MALTDPVTRSAARIAALVAVPLAVLAGVGAFALLGNPPEDGSGAPAAPGPGRTGPAATGPVEMAAPELADRAGVVCRALLARLPADLDGLAQRPVTAGPEQNAAFGDPPVTVACGAPAAQVPPTGEVYSLSGVCWFAAERPDATVWTTVDREVPVRVTVPAGYPGPGQRVVPVSTTVAWTIRSAGDIPAGCTG